MSARRRIAPALAGLVLAGSLAACGGGDDKAEQTDSGSSGGTSTSAPAASMDPGMDHSKMEDMPGMDHPAEDHP